jgi:hypothetical protein
MPDLMLHYGLGQLLESSTEEGKLVSLDAYVTRTVVRIIGENARWSAGDVIDKEIMNAYTTQTRASLGISFQMLVSSALCEFDGTISELTTLLTCFVDTLCKVHESGIVHGDINL